jgi:hypothetical protein
MERLILFFLLLSLASCTRSTPLRMEELSILGREGELLAKNSIDTVFLLIHNKIHGFQKGDTVGLIVYDRGRVICDRSRWSNASYFEYDTLGFLDKFTQQEWDVFLDYEVSYRFVPDTLALYQDFKSEYGFGNYCNLYRFDSERRLLSSRIYRADDFIMDQMMQFDSRHKTDTTDDLPKATELINSYDDSGLLVHQNEFLCDEHRKIKKAESVFYYSRGNLDSVVTNNNLFHYSTRTYYGSNGLRHATAYNDTLRLTYLYSKRAQ